MANRKMHEDFFDLDFPVEEKKEEAQLTPPELQRIVMELSRRVAKLERHHAKF